jgi:2-oxo-4-hydroxy-4-carboxy-5-ureidoimidazoline decarboxylase
MSTPAPGDAESSRLAVFNGLPDNRARVELLSCCTSPAWAEQMLAARPYRSVEEALGLADRAVASLSEAELDAALAGHPRIGERAAAQAHDGRDWSSQEQSGVDGVAESVRQALTEGNRAYERRFGHVYLVCATGKSADQMLGLLNQRMGNDPATERSVVRAELAKINRIRLKKLLADPLGEQEHA